MSRLKDMVFENRVLTLKKKMKEQHIELMLVYSDVWRRNNVAYLTDYCSGAGGIGQAWNMLMLPIDEAPILLTGFEMTGDAALQARLVKQFLPSYALGAELTKFANMHNPKKVGIIGNEIISHKIYSVIATALNGAEIVDCDALIYKDRWIKTEEEIHEIKKATRINDKAMAAVIDAIKDGISEIELYAIGASIIAGDGAELSFFPSVSVGTNSAIAMKRPSHKKIEKDNLVLLDFGAIYEGYASDTSRTVGYCLVDPYKRSILETALKSREAALEQIKPGAKMRDVEATIRNVIIQGGFGEYLLHNSGHGLGIDSSEEDFPMSLESEGIIQKGMVFSVEPGIYIPGVGGCRIEEVVHVTQSGCEVFSELRPDYFIDK